MYEAVIDLAGPRPRIAYLRDITLLATTAIMAVNASLDRDETEPEEKFEGLYEEDEAVSFMTANDEAGPAADTETADIDDPFAGPGAGADTPPPKATPSRRRIGRWRGG